MEIKDSTWNAKTDIKRLDSIEEYPRKPVLRATRKLFLDFYNENFQGNERVLEVGSGTGFLRRNWPDEYNGEWIQLDSSICILEEAQKRFPEGIYKWGYANELPFKDNNFDVVCGYSSYDVLFDLEGAIKEASRVLKKGGLFFHMLDIYPNEKPIDIYFFNMEGPREKEVVEVPYSEVAIKSIKYIPKENLDEYDRLTEFVKKKRQRKKALKKVKRLYKKLDTHDFFEEMLIKSLLPYFNSETIESGKLLAKYKGKRTNLQENDGLSMFRFINNAGNSRYNSNFLQILKNTPQDFFHTYNKFFYECLNLIAPSIAKKIEPSCIETSVVRYVKARK